MPPDVKTLFEEKLGSPRARRMAASARLVCTGWSRSLSFSNISPSNNAAPKGANYRLLDGAKTIAWVMPPADAQALVTRAKNLTSLSLNYLKLVFDPENYPSSSFALDGLLRDEGFRPELLESLSLTYCTMKARDFERVGLLRALKTLCLSDATVDDGALRHMSSLRALTELDISSSDRVTDAGLAALPGSLTSLKASRCDRVTDAGLAVLPRGLSSLDASHCERVTDAGLGHLGRLETLKIDYCPGINGSGLAFLSGVGALSTSRKCCDFASLAAVFCFAGLARLQSLATLDVSGIRIDGELFLPSVTSLTFRFAERGQLSKLRVPALAHLGVYGSPGVSVADLARFGGTLTSLSVDASRVIADGGLKALGEALPRLKTLALAPGTWCYFCVTVDFSGLAAHLPAVTALDLSGLGVRDSDLVHLGHLSSLDLFLCQSVTSAGLRHLTGLTSVCLKSCPGVKDKLAIEELWKTVKDVEF